MKGRGEKERRKKKRIYLLKLIYEGVPPTLKVAKYIRFFVKKKKGSFAVNETAVMDNAAAR